MLNGVHISGIKGIPEVEEGDDVGTLIYEAISEMSFDLNDGDIVVVTQKIVSKSEGKLINLNDVEVEQKAFDMALTLGKDPRLVQLILSESKSVVRCNQERGILITETKHGFVCANSGIDSSNVKGNEVVALLPDDSDASARSILKTLKSLSGCDKLGVIVTDTFGRAWREGHVNFSIGTAGFDPFIDYKDTVDAVGKNLKVTNIAVADELAAASELVTGKALNIPAVLIRGACLNFGVGSHQSLIRAIENDMFR
tara:strand:- start:606 stop:1370 length:765 start_codon:yes stop_codon:yes gene_type:complete